MKEKGTSQIAVIIGAEGEVGSSLAKVLSGTHEVFTKDLGPAPRPIPTPVDVMHVCIRHSEKFVDVVKRYAKIYQPAIIDVCTTVPPGTTAQLGENACHSTIRGLHPDLARSIKTFVKHISGPRAAELALYYQEAGVKTRTHARPETTELAHILSNAVYGVNLLFADEMAALCRHYGVDYSQAVLAYNQTSNDGYERLDHKSKLRMLLTPPGGHIGGHCVRQGASLIPKELRGRLLDQLAEAA